MYFVDIKKMKRLMLRWLLAIVIMGVVIWWLC
jgi:hypothetical protein